MLICTTSELEDVCGKLNAKRPQFIAVDTEFIRNNITYYPKLSLIQIAYEKESFIVDTLAPSIDLLEIEKIMLNKDITKIFHSCRQDMESLLTVFKDIPSPIFDTQIAAMFCCYYHDFIGYAKLIEQYMDLALNKIKAKKSNWLKRPLSKEQIEYAMDDVIYLYGLYNILHNKLAENNRIKWFQEEIEIISDINKYTHNPQHMWKKNVHNTDSVVVRAVSQWREVLAQRYNINRNRIINNSVISNLIVKNFRHVDEVLSYLEENAKDVAQDDLLELIDIFNDSKAIQCDSYHNYDKPLFDILSIILENRCQTEGISRKLVASKGELIKSVSGLTDNLFKGWRYDFFGKFVQSFINEELKFEISAIKSEDNLTLIQSRPIWC